MFLITELIAFLCGNLILNQALGISTMFTAAKDRKNLIGTAAVITIFTTFASAFACFIDLIFPQTDIRLLLYVVAVGIIYIGLLFGLKKFSGKNFVKYRKYIHISAFNCAVMGTVFTIGGTAENAGFFRYISAGIEAGAGFVLASLILTAAYKRLDSEKVPPSFRGFPAMLVYLGIISMALYALK
ncbi:MAG: hypothetical protein IJM19_02820 [Ruminococcus sp.]|nr:hypothetical protein [Ruminococcus sp.]MBR6386435.1 hypothetical protein [Ruminococcus sp.]